MSTCTFEPMVRTGPLQTLVWQPVGLPRLPSRMGPPAWRRLDSEGGRRRRGRDGRRPVADVAAVLPGMASATVAPALARDSASASVHCCDVAAVSGQLVGEAPPPTA